MNLINLSGGGEGGSETNIKNFEFRFNVFSNEK